MTPHISRLELVWRTREGHRTDGGWRTTHRDYLDFVVDRDPLSDTLGAAAMDLIGCLAWGSNAEYQQGLVEQFLLERPAELDTGRLMLYVCPECGDIGCGAITLVAEQDGDYVAWNQFAHERDYSLDDEPLFDLSEYANIGPFYFDRSQYREALTNWPKRE